MEYISAESTQCRPCSTADRCTSLLLLMFVSDCGYLQLSYTSKALFCGGWKPGSFSLPVAFWFVFVDVNPPLGSHPSFQVLIFGLSAFYSQTRSALMSCYIIHWQCCLRHIATVSGVVSTHSNVWRLKVLHFIGFSVFLVHHCAMCKRKLSLHGGRPLRPKLLFFFLQRFSVCTVACLGRDIQ